MSYHDIRFHHRTTNSFIVVLFYYFPFLSFYPKKNFIGIFFLQSKYGMLLFSRLFENMVSFYFHDFFEIVKHSEYTTSHKKKHSFFFDKKKKRYIHVITYKLLYKICKVFPKKKMQGLTPKQKNL